ncbi:MAG: Abi family protein [Devosia sp.]
MSIPDEAKASEYLSRLGYYRLSAYWYPFRVTSGGVVTDNFKAGTSFKWALDLYSFDKKLRLQLLDVLERIEIFVRTAVALQLGQFDSHAHRNPKLLDSKFTRLDPRTKLVAHTEWLATLDNKARFSKEEFAEHFRSKYSTSHMPIWIAVELLDFGPLSMLLSGMKWVDVDAIARSCGAVNREVLASWIRSLSVVRNVCAHHSRLWNKPLVDQPRLPPPGSVQLLNHVSSSPFGAKRLYAACAVARYLLLKVNPRTEWSTRLKDHLATFPTNQYISPKTMGFPEGWESLPLWA